MSNLFWRYDGVLKNVDISIIDWDAAFLVADGVPVVWQRMWDDKPKWRLYKTRLGVVSAHALDDLIVHVLEYYLMPDRSSAWDELATSTDSNALFRKMCCAYVCDTGFSLARDECCTLHRNAYTSTQAICDGGAARGGAAAAVWLGRWCPC